MKQSIIIKTSAIAMIAACLSACADPRKASSATFKTVIQKSLDGSPACITANVPSETQDWQGKHRPDEKLEALVAVGLVSVKAAGVTPSILSMGMEQPNRKIPGLRYELTEKAKVFAKEEDKRDKRAAVMASMFGQSSQLLRFGDKKVVDIVRYSEPSAAMGQTVTEVTYTYRLAHVADWAKDPSVTKQYRIDDVLDAQDHPREERLSLVLMSDGWQVPEGIFK